MLKTLATIAFVAFALPAAAQSVNGTVTKVDTAQGKLTINHGPIKNLDMDAMTMVFRAGDPAHAEGAEGRRQDQVRRRPRQRPDHRHQAPEGEVIGIIPGRAHDARPPCLVTRS